MKKFILQYSVPADTRMAVSEWVEHTVSIIAATDREAIKKFNASHQHLGTWMVLDCWEVDFVGTKS